MYVSVMVVWLILAIPLNLDQILFAEFLPFLIFLQDVFVDFKSYMYYVKKTNQRLDIGFFLISTNSIKM